MKNTTEQEEFKIYAKTLYKSIRSALILSINNKIIRPIKTSLLNKFNFSSDSLSVDMDPEKNTPNIFYLFKSLTLLDDYFTELHNALSKYKPDEDNPEFGTNEFIKTDALANLVSKHSSLLLK